MHDSLKNSNHIERNKNFNPQPLHSHNSPYKETVSTN